MNFIYLGVTAMAAWFLVAGLRSADMSAMGAPFATYRRNDHAVGFWFAAFFNLLVLVAGLLLLAEELLK